MVDSSLISRLKQRKLFQWALAYAAGAWALLEGVDLVGGQFGWPQRLLQSITILVAVGFLVTLVLAWYHGERGRQRVGGVELLVLATILTATGFLLRGLPSDPTDIIASADAGSASRVSLEAQLFDNPAVAVLPFSNLGGEDDRTLVEGMHQEILDRLARIGALTVLSRQAVLRYRDSEMGISEIARELDADAVLEGTVRRAGEQLRVSAQLIDPPTGAYLWNDTYDRSLTTADIFEVQESVARAVAEALEAALTPDEEDAIATHETDDLTAYQLVLAADELGGDTELRIELYRQALSRDSTFAGAWARLGIQYALAIQNLGWDAGWADSSKAAADRAILLDPTISRAYQARAYADWLGRGRIGPALSAMSTALELAPNRRLLARNFGVMHENTGRYPEAMGWFRRAQRLDPRGLTGRVDMAEVYIDLGLYERADSMLEDHLRSNPGSQGNLQIRSMLEARRENFAEAIAAAEEWAGLQNHPRRHGWVAWVALLGRDWHKAVDRARKAEALAPAGLSSIGATTRGSTLAAALLMTGDTIQASQRLDTLAAQFEERVAQGWDLPYVRFDLATVEAARGDFDSAVSWLQSAYEAGFRDFRVLELHPTFDALRGTPEFDEILDRMRADVEDMRLRVLEQDRALAAAQLARAER